MRARARAYTEETRRRISQVVVVTKTDLPEVEADAEAKLAALRKKKNDALTAQMHAEMHKKSLEKKYPALNAVRTEHLPSQSRAGA